MNPTCFTVLIAFAINIKSDVKAGSCLLEGIPQTSPSNLYLLPPLPDNLLEGSARVWQIQYTGLVKGVSTPLLPHYTYLTASFSARNGSEAYWFVANSKTKNFVRDFQTREMIRYGTLRCSDNSNTTYNFKIPFQDMQAPKFSESEYTFNITADWAKDKPISDGQFVTMSDNAIELEKNPKWLKFSIIPNDIIRVEEHPLWVLPNPENYYFRLDFYLKDDVKLEAGRTFQINISVRDEFNSGTTKLTINVSS